MKNYLTSNLEDPLYREIILEHWQNPLNYGMIKKPDFKVQGINPTCGDKIVITGKIKNNKLTEIKFTSKGCAISKSFSSLLTETVKGKDISKINKITEEETLKSLPVLINPSRYNCALLGVRTLKKILGD